MRAIKTRFFFLLLPLCLTGTSVVLAQPFQPRGEQQFIPPQQFPRPNTPQEGLEDEELPRFRGKPRGEGFRQRREEQHRRLERARHMALRLLDDPSTPDDVKAKARRLNDLLSKREGLERELDGKRQDFLRAHSQELNELRQLQERGEIIRQNLRSAREKALAESLPTIQEMRRTTQEAREVRRR